MATLTSSAAAGLTNLLLPMAQAEAAGEAAGTMRSLLLLLRALLLLLKQVSGTRPGRETAVQRLVPAGTGRGIAAEMELETDSAVPAVPGV